MVGVDVRLSEKLNIHRKIEFSAAIVLNLDFPCTISDPRQPKPLNHARISSYGMRNSSESSLVEAYSLPQNNFCFLGSHVANCFAVCSNSCVVDIAVIRLVVAVGCEIDVV